MGRRDERRVHVFLHPGQRPAPDERDAILRAADELIARGGRTLLCRMLRGSKAADVLKHGLDRCPAYGRLAHLPEDDVLSRIDAMIRDGWLAYEYFHKLPLLVHTPRGWERTRELWVDELLAAFAEWIRQGEPAAVWPRLETINRQIKLQLLDRIVRDQRTDLRPILEAWRLPEVRKMRAAIGHALDELARATAIPNRASMSDASTKLTG